MNPRSVLLIAFAIVFALLGVANLSGQTAPGTLHGQVTDPSGAVVSDATVTVTSAAGQASSTQTNRVGSYEVKGLAPGTYTIGVTSKGFSAYQLPNVVVSGGQSQQLDIALGIAVQQEKVQVEDETTNVDLNPSNNASSTVIKGKDLDALSDDPDELQSDLQALAGPSAGPNGGQIYIDGFTGGQLPPKSSIREIRINQNPFSAQYDRLGYGRIEILTKPGTDSLHGQVFSQFNDSALNTRNPFVSQAPDYRSQFYNANIGGKINKKSSFFLSFQRRNIDDSAIVNAFILDPSLNQTAFNQAVNAPRVRSEFSPRLDYQLTPSNTLTARYEYNLNDQQNQGIGQFSLASQAYTMHTAEHEFRVSDTQVLNPTTINETRFQFVHQDTTQNALNSTPTINVLQAFVGGGSRVGVNSDLTNRYEFQNYTSMARGKHFVKFGARLRGSTETNQSTGSFNGAFTFSSLISYQITQQGLQQGLTPAQIRATCSSDPAHPELPPQCGGASQFSIITGQPVASIGWMDAGLYAEDDWRVLPKLTLSYGLRFESQNDINDHADIAPRIGLSWGIGGGKSAPKTVLRAGWGIFYDRFGQDQVLQAARLNGTNQQQFVVSAPDFYPNIPPTSSLTGSTTSPTIYQIDPNVHSPYTIQTALTLERQVTRTSTLTLTYLNSRGVHQYLVRNINAPLPGTYNPLVPSSGVRPKGGTSNIYQYSSAGDFKQNQLISNFNIRVGSALTLFGNYTLGYANSDANGAGSFASNQYNLSADYGRAAFDVRHRVFVGGSLSLPYNVRLNPFVVANSGAPYNFTVGSDLNGDSIFNDRPAFATDLSRPSVVLTPYGAFDTAPIAGQKIVPVNYGSGPASFTFNLRVSKTIGLGRSLRQTADGGNGGRPGGPGGFGGPGGGGRPGPGGRGPGGPGGGRFGGGGGTADHRYNLTLSAMANNLLNHVNPAAPIGNLNSPLFGVSNSLAGGPFGSQTANRRIELQVMMSF